MFKKEACSVCGTKKSATDYWLVSGTCNDCSRKELVEQDQSYRFLGSAVNREKPWRVEYEASLEEIIAVTRDIQDGMKSLRSSTRRSKLTVFIGVILLAWSLAYLALGLFVVFITSVGGSVNGVTSSYELVFAGIVGVIVSIINTVTSKSDAMRERQMEWRMASLRRFYQEYYGHDGPFRCQVELRDDCLWTKKDSIHAAYDWSIVRQVIDGPDSVVFRIHGGDMVVVRDRGFASAETREKFLALARERSATSNPGQAMAT